MRNQEKLIVKQDPENPVGVEVFEQAIVDIAKAMRLITGSRLRREAIVVLIKDRSGLNKSTIELVLNNLESLEETWLHKKKEKTK